MDWLRNGVSCRVGSDNLILFSKHKWSGSEPRVAFFSLVYGMSAKKREYNSRHGFILGKCFEVESSQFFRDNIQEELKVELDALLMILSDVDLLNNAYDIFV